MILNAKLRMTEVDFNFSSYSIAQWLVWAVNLFIPIVFFPLLLFALFIIIYFILFSFCLHILFFYVQSNKKFYRIFIGTARNCCCYSEAGKIRFCDCCCWSLRSFAYSYWLLFVYIYLYRIFFSLFSLVLFVVCCCRNSRNC